MLGIGGGGDAVGSIAVARAFEARGRERFSVASRGSGSSWTRIRALAGSPRSSAHGRSMALPIVDPAVGATTPEGVHFCESHLATHLGEPTVLIDVTAGAAGAARGISAACADLGCDLVLLVDIGGDAIADGSEPGLASPLCDAVMIAAGAACGLPCLLGVLGAGCDGELEPAEVLARVSDLSRVGAWLDTLESSADDAARSRQRPKWQ